MAAGPRSLAHSGGKNGGVYEKENAQKSDLLEISRSSTTDTIRISLWKEDSTYLSALCSSPYRLVDSWPEVLGALWAYVNVCTGVHHLDLERCLQPNS